jgi:hypothetical protein
MGLSVGNQQGRRTMASGLKALGGRRARMTIAAKPELTRLPPISSMKPVLLALRSRSAHTENAPGGSSG